MKEIFQRRSSKRLDPKYHRRVPLEKKCFTQSLFTDMWFQLLTCALVSTQLNCIGEQIFWHQIVWVGSSDVCNWKSGIQRNLNWIIFFGGKFWNQIWSLIMLYNDIIPMNTITYYDPLISYAWTKVQKFIKYEWNLTSTKKSTFIDQLFNGRKDMSWLLSV